MQRLSFLQVAAALSAPRRLEAPGPATCVRGIGALLCAGTLSLRACGAPWNDAAWTAVTTATNVGFGDVPLSGPERCITCGIACGGVALVGGLASAVIAVWTKKPKKPEVLRFVSTHLVAGIVAFRLTDCLTWGDAAYLAIMTATGTGGSASPRTPFGKVTTALYSLVSALVFARLVGSLAVVPLDRWRRAVLASYGERLTPETLADLARGPDVKALGLSDDDSNCTRDQFTLLALIKQKLISVDDLQDARAAFDALDRDGTGLLSQNDLDLLAQDTRVS